MEHGAESSISNSNGENALDVARRCGKPRIIGKASKLSFKLHIYSMHTMVHPALLCMYTHTHTHTHTHTVDGTKQCSMCVNKAAKEKLEEASKPSPVHKPKWKQNEGSLFLHPLPQSHHERYIVPAAALWI